MGFFHSKVIHQRIQSTHSHVSHSLSSSRLQSLLQRWLCVIPWRHTTPVLYHQASILTPHTSILSWCTSVATSVILRRFWVCKNRSSRNVTSERGTRVHATCQVLARPKARGRPQDPWRGNRDSIGGQKLDLILQFDILALFFNARLWLATE